MCFVWSAGEKIVDTASSSGYASEAPTRKWFSSLLRTRLSVLRCGWARKSIRQGGLSSVTAFSLHGEGVNDTPRGAFDDQVTPDPAQWSLKAEAGRQPGRSGVPGLSRRDAGDYHVNTNRDYQYMNASFEPVRVSPNRKLDYLTR